MSIKQAVYTCLGVISVALGTAGIFLPLLPTTPFLLLATILFSRGNDRLNDWLLTHKHLGPYIHAFRNKNGLTRAQKIRVATSFTVMFGVSMWFVPLLVVKIGLATGWMFWMAYLYQMKNPTLPVQGQSCSVG